MRALRFPVPGDPSKVLRLEEIPDPVPGPGELRLRMALRPINPSDLLQVEGVYGRRPDLPAIAGLEGFGIVDALGPGVVGWSLGQRALPLRSQGTWADFLVARTEDCVPVPEGLADDQAAQAGVNPLTAWLLAGELDLGPGKVLLQSAAASVVGRCLVQLARSRGYRTVNLVRRPESIMPLLSLGADAVICTADPDWPAQAARFLPEGAHAGADAVGGRLAGEMLKLLRPVATLAVYGALSREPLQIPGGQLIFRTATVRGFWLTEWKRRTPPEARRSTVDTLLQVMAQGALRCPVDATFPLDRWPEAVARATTTGRDGKVLLGGE